MFHRDLKGPALHAPTNERVENNTGATIQKLQVVSLDGHGTLYPQVILANPSVQSNFGIAMQEIVNGGNGYVTTVGFMVQVDTSSWPVNTLLYSDANANLTSVPNGNPVAIVVKQDDTCGSLYVLALGDQLQYPSWHLNGNIGTDPDVNFLGTQDNVGLTLKTNNTQRIRIDETGKVLIGDSAEQTPKYFFHLKQHSGFAGSGHMKETAAIQVDNLIFNNIYSFQVPNMGVITGTFRITAIQGDNAEQASFIRSGTWFRNGSLAQEMGIIQSDFTNKSNSNFDLDIIKTGDTVIIKVKNANATNTKWLITAQLDIMINN